MFDVLDTFFLLDAGAVPLTLAATSFALGALVLLLGLGLPAGLDAAFELVVGLTLVTLGGVVHQLGRYRSHYRYTGRISLVVGALRRGWARARRREVPGDVFDVDWRGAFLVGLLHGKGAETPTHIALGGVTGLASLTLGLLIVTGHSALVPPLASS